MHEAEVHVFSDSVLCLGKSAMTSSEIKFTKKDGKSILSTTKTPQRELMENQVNSHVHIFSCARTNEVMLNIDEWIRQGQGED